MGNMASSCIVIRRAIYCSIHTPYPYTPHNSTLRIQAVILRVSHSINMPDRASGGQRRTPVTIRSTTLQYLSHGLHYVTDAVQTGAGDTRDWPIRRIS